MHTVDGNDVETDRVIRRGRVAGEVHAGGTNDFALFTAIDRVTGTAEAMPAAITHFNEDQALAVFRNDVDFAVPAMEIPAKDAQSLLAQKLGGPLFCGIAPAAAYRGSP